MLLAVTLLGLGQISIPAMAEAPRVDDALVARGYQVAAGRCGRCHAIGREDESPQQGVTPFRELQARYPIEMLVEARRSGIVSGHDEMPMTALGPEDMAALLALIDSFSPPGQKRYRAP